MTKISDLNSHNPAIITLSKTMLDKSTIDANNSVRNLSKLLGVDFEKMGNGDKKTVEAEYLDGAPTTINFYRTKDRSDRRLSIRDIKHKANAGDIIAITTKTDKNGNTILVINISIETQFAKLATQFAKLAEGVIK